MNTLIQLKEEQTPDNCVVVSSMQDVSEIIDRELLAFLSSDFDPKRKRNELLNDLPVALSSERWPHHIAFRATSFIKYLKGKDIRICPRDLSRVLRRLGLQPSQFSLYSPEKENCIEVTRAWVMLYDFEGPAGAGCRLSMVRKPMPAM